MDGRHLEDTLMQPHTRTKPNLTCSLSRAAQPSVDQPNSVCKAIGLKVNAYCYKAVEIWDDLLYYYLNDTFSLYWLEKKYCQKSLDMNLASIY